MKLLKKEIIIEAITNKLHEFHWGHFIVGKFQFILWLALIVKVYKIPNTYKIIILLSGLAIIWVTGVVFVKYFKEPFNRRNNKEIMDLMDKKENGNKCNNNGV